MADRSVAFAVVLISVSLLTGPVLSVAGTSVGEPESSFVGGERSTQGSASLTGFVVANERGDERPEAGNLTYPPVRSATVQIVELGESTPTDLFGFYELRDLPAGTYTVRVSAPGFATATEELTIEGDRRQVFFLNRTAGLYDIHVRAVGMHTGLRLANATVTVDGQTRRTDADGQVSFRYWPRGAHDVSVQLDGYDEWSGTVSIGPYAKFVRVLMAPIEPHTIQGTVTDRNGEVIDHGTVTVTGVAPDGREVLPPRRFYLRETGGRYDATDLPPLPGGAHYEVAVRATGYVSSNATVAADPGGDPTTTTVDVDLSRIPTTTRIRLHAPVYRSGAGEPMPVIGAEVVMNGTGDVTGGVREVGYTDANGTVEFDTLLPGTYQVRLTRYELYETHPPGVRSVEGTRVVHELAANLTASLRQSRCAFRSGVLCREWLVYPERSRTVTVVAVTDDEPNGFSFNRTPSPGMMALRFRGFNGTHAVTGEDRYEPLSNVTVKSVLPDTVDPTQAGPQASRNDTIGMVDNLDGEVYFVNRTPMGGLPNRTDAVGQIGLWLYPAYYDIEAIKIVDDPAPFPYFYGILGSIPLRVGSENRTEFSYRMLPTWTTFEGTVRDVDHRVGSSSGPRLPIPNATVTFRGDGVRLADRSRLGRTQLNSIEIPDWAQPRLPSTLGGRTVSTTTGSDGRFAVRVPADNYTIEASAPGYRGQTYDASGAPVTVRRLLFLGDAPGNHRIGLRADGGDVTVKIREPDIVTDQNGDRKCAGLSESTLSNPTFYSERFDALVSGGDNLPPGEYTVTQPWEAPQTVTVAPGSDLTVTFTSGDYDHTDDSLTCDNDIPYTAFVLHGVVRAVEDSLPVASATVNLTYEPASGPTQRVATTVTGPDGEFTFRGSDPFHRVDDYRVRVTKGAEFVPRIRDVGIVGGTTTFTSVTLRSAQGRLRVAVQNASGAPLDAATVRLSGQRRTDIEAATDDTGRAVFRPLAAGAAAYDLLVSSGETPVSVSKPGYYHPASDTGSYEDRIAIPTSRSVQNHTMTVTLAPIPPPTVRSANLTKGPSSDTTGLFLEGVALPAAATALVAPPSAPSGEGIRSATLVVNRGDPDREWRTSVDGEHIEGPFENGSYRVRVPFDVRYLPEGRNTFDLVVTSDHGARTVHRIVTDAGAPYRLDVLRIPDWLSGVLTTAATVTAPGGDGSATVGLGPFKPNRNDESDYSLGGSAQVTVEDEGRYPSYELTLQLGLGISRQNPIDELHAAKPTLGVDHQLVPEFKLSFDGQTRNLTISGGADLQSTGAVSVQLQGALVNEITVTTSASGGARLGAAAGYGPPIGTGPDFAVDIAERDRVTGSIEQRYQAKVSNAWLTSAAGLTAVGAFLDRIDTQLFLSTRGKTDADVLLLYDDMGGVQGYLLLPEGEAPTLPLPDGTQLTFTPEIGLGGGAEVWGHEAISFEVLANIALQMDPSLPLPFIEQITGSYGIQAQGSVTSYGPSFSEQWILGEGTLYEFAEPGGGGPASLGAPGVPTVRDTWNDVDAGRRFFATSTSAVHVRESSATVTRVESRYDPVSADRFWNVSGYSTVAWAAGNTSGSLVENAYPGAAPTVAGLGIGDGIAIYVRDDVTAPSLATRLRFATFEGETRSWSTPADLPDGTDVEDPVAARIGGGRVLVIWRSMSGLDDRVNPLLTMNRSELHYAIYAGGRWGPVRTLTSNSVYERAPAVAGDGGRAMAVWTTVPSGYPLDRTPGIVRYALLGSADDERGPIADGVTLPGTPAVAYRDGRGIVAYTVDIDRDLGTLDDRRIVVSTYRDGRWTAPEAVTDPGRVATPSVTLTRDGARLVWVENSSTVRTATLVDGRWETRGVAARAPGARDLQLLEGATGPVLVWRAFGGSAASLFYAVGNASGAGFEAPIALTDERVYGPMSVSLDDAGDTLLVTSLAKPNATRSQTVPPDVRFFVRELSSTGLPEDYQVGTPPRAGGSDDGDEGPGADRGRSPGSGPSGGFPGALVVMILLLLAVVGFGAYRYLQRLDGSGGA